MRKQAITFLVVLICQDEYIKLERNNKITKSEVIFDIDKLYGVNVFKNNVQRTNTESLAVLDNSKKESIFEKILKKLRILKRK